MFRQTIILVFLFFLSLGVKAQIDSAGNITCFVPSLPQFPGGNDSLKKYVKDNLKWPGLEWCGQGSVYVKFKVDCKGHVSGETILKALTV